VAAGQQISFGDVTLSLLVPDGLAAMAGGVSTSPLGNRRSPTAAARPLGGSLSRELNRHVAAIETLRGLLDVTATTHTLSVEERVVIVSAVLTSELGNARLAGLVPARLDELLRAGEQVSVGMAGTEPAASPAAPAAHSEQAAAPGPADTPPPMGATPASEPARDASQPTKSAAGQPPATDDRGSPPEPSTPTNDAATAADEPALVVGHPVDPADTTPAATHAGGLMLNLDDLFGDAPVAHAEGSTPLPGDALVSMFDPNPQPTPQLAVSPDELLPAVEPIADDDDAPQPHEGLRRHRRVTLSAEVMVRLLGHPDPIALMTRDISLGGMFLVTAQTLPVSGRLIVELSTPAGPLHLPGRIVHVAGANPVVGYGVAFDPLAAAAAEKLEAFLSAAPAASPMDTGEETPPALGLVAELKEGLDGGNLYGALGVEPAATQADVLLRIKTARQELEAAAQGASDAITGRLNEGLKMLERIQKVLGSLKRRAAYDFARGIVDVDRRFEEAERGDALDLTGLHQLWAQVFPDRVEAARAATTEGCALANRGDFAGAAKQADAALQDDPFRPELRAQGRRWTGLAEMTRYVDAGTAPEGGWLAWAAAGGHSHAELREHWQLLAPASVKRASKLVRRALQAEIIKRFDVAAQSAVEALALAPFNEELRTAHAGWEEALAATEA
jgi:hypothetical protein